MLLTLNPNLIKSNSYTFTHVTLSPVTFTPIAMALILDEPLIRTYRYIRSESPVETIMQMVNHSSSLQTTQLAVNHSLPLNHHQQLPQWFLYPSLNFRQPLPPPTLTTKTTMTTLYQQLTSTRFHLLN